MNYLFLVLCLIIASCSTQITTHTLPNRTLSSLNQNWLSPHSQTHPLTGKIWNTKNNEFITTIQLVENINNSRYLLVGERHDNPDHHRIERGLIEQTQFLSDNTTVTFEMLDHQQFKDIDLSSIKKDTSLDQLKIMLNWPENNSWPWKNYGPLILAALKGGSTLKAGNINRKTLRQLAKETDSNQAKEFKRNFSTLVALPDTIKQLVLNDVYNGHCQVVPKSHLTSMVSIQTMRDAYMASNLYQPDDNTKSVLIAGNGHIREDYGAGWHIQQRDPEANVMSVALIEVEENFNVPSDYTRDKIENQNAYDYIWFTPKFSHIDHCAKFKSMMRKKGSQ